MLLNTSLMITSAVLAPQTLSQQYFDQLWGEFPSEMSWGGNFLQRWAVGEFPSEKFLKYSDSYRTSVIPVLLSDSC